MTKKELIARQQAIVDAAKNVGRALTAQEQQEFENLQRSLESMPDDNPEAGGDPDAAGGSGNNGGTKDLSPEEAAQRAIAEERKRIADISALCRSFGMQPDEYISGGQSMDQVRCAVLEKMQKDGAPINVRVNADEGDKFRDAATDALVLRAGVRVAKPAEGAGELRGMSLRDLAVECLVREGEDARSLIRMSADDLYNSLSRQFYNPTAAFPAILDATIRKSVVELYNQVPTTFQEWTTDGSLSDFKETSDHEYLIGGMGDFEEVPENGEIKADLPKTELLPTRKLKTFGKQFSMTRQAFVNDDIGFLTRVPGLYATKAKKTIDKQVYQVLYYNQAIFDKKALFDKTHNNLIAKGAKPSQQSVQEIILQMQKQTDPFGDAIYVNPKFIIVPVGYEFDLAVMLHSTQVTGSNNNDYNPMYNYPLKVVQTPILNALAGNNPVPWFMVADPMSARSVHVDYLNNQKTPTIRRMEAPGVLGFTWDIYMDWDITVRDFRGIAKNPGVAI